MSSQLKTEIPASLDRAWFKKHAGRNFRVRDPAPGEVEEIMRRSHGAMPYELALLGGEAKPPAEGLAWAILVIDAGRDLLIKAVMLKPGHQNGPSEAGWTLGTIALMNRLFMIRTGG